MRRERRVGHGQGRDDVQDPKCVQIGRFRWNIRFPTQTRARSFRQFEPTVSALDVLQRFVEVAYLSRLRCEEERTSHMDKHGASHRRIP